ncbi:MAG: OmpH family outer membrane protein [Geobacter sp.]|nr:OmpH family outer membrane protein [Geobacter sp.]
MHNNFKKLLIAVMIALPTLANAADSTTAPTPNSAAPVVAAKPTETAAAIKSPKLGYVDIESIGGESDRGKALKALLTSRKDALQAKFDSKKKQIEKLKSSIEAKLPLMNPKQREAKSKEFQKKLEEFQKFAQTSEEELYKLQEKETKALFEEIEKSAVAYGKANDFAAIIIKKELLYLSNAVDAQDVTAALIKSLNEAGQKK